MIHFTESASSFVTNLVKNKIDDNISIRVSVANEDYAEDYDYEIELVNSIETDDITYNTDELPIQIVVNKNKIKYIDETEIDLVTYNDDIIFVFRNPNVIEKTTS